MKIRPAGPKRTIAEIQRFCLSIFDSLGDAKGLQFPDLAKHGGIPIRYADEYASAGKYYGFLTSVYGSGYSIDGAKCKALKYPAPGEKEKLLLDAFTFPDIYKLIINEFNHKKITPDGISHVLIRTHDFPEKGAKETSRVFIENANLLGLIDSSGHLNLDAEITISEPQVKEKSTQAKASTGGKSKKSEKPEQVKGKKPATVVQHTPIIHTPEPAAGLKPLSVYVRGKELVLHVPDDMKRNDLEAIIKQLQNVLQFMK
ncbi:MAG: hypothetical protein JST90_16855 [Bacteroidetes bacterium]|nr:hypothetical protein [Bacteroidota bacterium]